MAHMEILAGSHKPGENCKKKQEIFSNKFVAERTVLGHEDPHFVEQLAIFR